MANISTEVNSIVAEIHALQRKVITYTGHKGGIGKTTHSVNAAAWWANQGLRVALLDIDAQANVGEFLGLDPAPCLHNVLVRDKTIESQLVEAPDPAWRFKRGRGYLHVMTGDTTNESVWDKVDDQHALRNAILELLDTGNYDLVVLDSPPAHGKFSTSIMQAAGWMIIPAVPSKLPYKGIESTIKSMNNVYKRSADWSDDAKPVIELLGIIPSRVKRTILHETYLERMKERWTVFPGVPELTALEETTELERTIWTYALGKNDRSSDSARQYFSAIMEAVTKTLQSKGVLNG